MTPEPFKSHALMYAQRGFLVVPIKAKAKGVPLTKNGSKDGSNDPKQIEEWIKEFPGANIALVSGPKSGARGMMFVDVDKHHGGFQTMRALVDRHGDLPKGPRSVTPHGGVHMFFAFNGRIVQGNDKLGQGIDIKTTNGMATAPPSYWDGMKGGEEILPGGGFYRWLIAPHGTTLPVLPDWAVRLLTPVKTPQKAATVDYSDPTNEQLMDLLAYIPNTERDLWIKVGMGLKSTLGDAGFALWDTWSATGYEKYKSSDTRTCWRSFRGDGVGIATIVYQARENGADLKEILGNTSLG